MFIECIPNIVCIMNDALVCLLCLCVCCSYRLLDQRQQLCVSFE